MRELSPLLPRAKGGRGLPSLSLTNPLAKRDAVLRRQRRSRDACSALTSGLSLFAGGQLARRESQVASPAACWAFARVVRERIEERARQLHAAVSAAALAWHAPALHIRRHHPQRSHTRRMHGCRQPQATLPQAEGRATISCPKRPQTGSRSRPSWMSSSTGSRASARRSSLQRSRPRGPAEAFRPAGSAVGLSS